MRATAVSTLASAIATGLLLASPAAAITSLNLIWDSSGTSTVTVFGSSTTNLTARLVVTLEAGDTLKGVGVSFVFDEDNQNELDFVSMIENPNVAVPPGGATNNFGPLLPGPAFVFDSQFTNAGLIEGFDSVTGVSDQGATGPITLTLGSVTFSTNGLRALNDSANGFDLRVAVLLNGLDGIVDGSGHTNCIGQMQRNDCPVTFGGAYVNAPEPTTGLLLAFGLGLGLYYQHRR